ncbi:hypothetical protein ACFWNL_17660 [Kitasatospora sp. NPDC058397]|uniref:hypothetical protein n=1 Tax=unclassified Kitasatospora TaxID=2633591 RepID=UPI00364B72BA
MAVNVLAWCLVVYIADLLVVLTFLLPWGGRPRVPGRAFSLERNRFVRRAAARRSIRAREHLLQAGVPESGVPNLSALRRRLAGAIAGRIALGARWTVPALALVVSLQLSVALHTPGWPLAVILVLIALTGVLAALDGRAYARSVPQEHTAMAAVAALEALTAPDLGEVRGKSRASTVSDAVGRFCTALTVHAECEPRRTDPAHRDHLRERARQVVERVLALREQSLWGDPESHRQLVAIVASVLQHVAQPTSDPQTTLNLVDPELVAPAHGWGTGRTALVTAGTPQRGPLLAPSLNQRRQAELVEAAVLLLVAAVAYLVAYVAARSALDDIASARFSPSDTAQVITAIGGAVAAGAAGVAGIIKACAVLIHARAEMVRARASLPSPETAGDEQDDSSGSEQPEATTA